MGLDASVLCNCVKEGLVIPKRFREYFEIVEGIPILSIDYSGNESLHEEFDRWLYECCPHHRMEYADERISNWGGLRLFQAALEENNEGGMFGTLLREIPDTNDGMTQPKDAESMLTELHAFEELGTLGQKYVLANGYTGCEIHEYIPQYAGVFILGHGQYNIGVDPDGFFIADKKNRVLFRSKHFIQEKLSRGWFSRKGRPRVRFTDMATRRTFVCDTEIGGEQIRWPDGEWLDAKGNPRFAEVTCLNTEYRERTVDEFEYIVEPLRIVCEASVKTGNPIVWS